MTEKQTHQAFKTQITIDVELEYLLYLPKDYDAQPQKRWPLVLFLHGAGERGHDLRIVTNNGIPKLINEGQDFPFIVLSPQCPPNRWWYGPTLLGLKSLLDKISHEYAVDTNRIYLTGLSMGGFGSWEMGVLFPDLFAAIAPICGGGANPKTMHVLKHVPIWTFHGDQDDIVPIHRTQELVDDLKAAGGNVKFTIYPGVNHNSWAETYANPEFYEWLLSQSKEA